MKATGIVRRIDDLGRVVIPKEIRRTLRIREGDPLEIFTDREGEVILKKYSPVGEMNEFAKGYVESLTHIMGHTACIADMDSIVAAAGENKKELNDKRINLELESIIKNRKTVLANRNRNGEPIHGIVQNDDSPKYTAQVIAPIVSEGEPKGAVILLSKNPSAVMDDTEAKLVQTAADFLSKQIQH